MKNKKSLLKLQGLILLFACWMLPVLISANDATTEIAKKYLSMTKLELLKHIKFLQTERLELIRRVAELEEIIVDKNLTLIQKNNQLTQANDLIILKNKTIERLLKRGGEKPFGLTFSITPYINNFNSFNLTFGAAFSWNFVENFSVYAGYNLDTNFKLLNNQIVFGINYDLRLF